MLRRFVVLLAVALLAPVDAVVGQRLALRVRRTGRGCGNSARACRPPAWSCGRRRPASCFTGPFATGAT